MSLARLVLRRLGVPESQIDSLSETQSRLRRQGFLLTARRVVEYYLTPAEFRDALVDRRREVEAKVSSSPSPEGKS